MTVQTSTTVATGIGNGVTTVFPVGFKFNRDEDLLVILIDSVTEEITQLALNSDYTVQGAGNEEGGSVTVVVPVPSGKSIRTARFVDLLQTTDLRNQGKFFAEVHEDAFDKIVMMAQQLQEQVDRAVKVPVSSDTPPEALYAEFKADIAQADAAAALSVEAKNESQAIAEQFGDVASAVEQTEALRDQSAASATASSTSAAQSETAAIRAEAAEGNAFVNANLYETTAEGIAATLLDAQFQVLSADGLEYVRYRHDTGGVATALGRFASGNSFRGVRESVSRVSGEAFQSAGVSQFALNGLIDMTGAFVASPTNYRCTDFIAVSPGDILTLTVYASSSVAMPAFYDSNKIFVSAIAGNAPADPTTTCVVPTGVGFFRASNAIGQVSAPTVVLQPPGIISEKDLLGRSDLSLIPTDNLATPERLLENQFIDTSGNIFNGFGWLLFKLPVTPGETYTFGRFSISDPGYRAFHDEAGSVLSSGSFLTSSLPVTVTAPTGAAFLYFNVARPANTPEESAQLTANVGAGLIDYTPPYLINAIKGLSLAGQVNPADYAKIGSDVTFGQVTADSIAVSVLMANLPSGASLPAGVEVNQAWIDTADNSVKVRLS